LVSRYVSGQQCRMIIIGITIETLKCFRTA
jgi:hypothetical protein